MNLKQKFPLYSVFPELHEVVRKYIFVKGPCRAKWIDITAAYRQFTYCKTNVKLATM